MNWSFTKSKEIDLFHENEILNKQIEAIEKVSHSLVSETTPDIILNEIVGTIPKVLGIYIASTLLWDEKNEIFTVSKTSVPDIVLKIAEKAINQKLEGFIYPNKDPNNIFVKTVKTKEIEFTSEIITSLTPIMELRYAKLITDIAKLQMGLLVSVPLKINESIIGILALGWKGKKFDDNDRRIVMTFANYASLALKTAGLIDEKNQYLGELKTKVTELDEQLRKERDMMDVIGHELRTPLSIARNAISLIQIEANKTTEPTISKEVVLHQTENISNSLKRELKQLETVLSSTKIENNRLQLTIEKVNCTEILKNTVEAYTPNAKFKNLELTSETSDQDIYCTGAKAQIEEILDNLVENAIKYTPKGSIKVILEKVKNEICFRVKDTGEGVPPDDIPQLGKKFFRSRMYTESDKNKDNFKIVRPGGTGIGLYVVKGLLALMNGRLEIESVVDKGSTFSFFLPAAE